MSDKPKCSDIDDAPAIEGIVNAEGYKEDGINTTVRSFNTIKSNFKSYMELTQKSTCEYYRQEGRLEVLCKVRETLNKLHKKTHRAEWISDIGKIESTMVRIDVVEREFGWMK